MFLCFSSYKKPRIWMSPKEFKFNKNTFLTYVLFFCFFLSFSVSLFMIVIIRLDRINQFICIYIYYIYCCWWYHISVVRLYGTNTLRICFVIWSVRFVRVCGWLKWLILFPHSSTTTLNSTLPFIWWRVYVSQAVSRHDTPNQIIWCNL